MQDWHDPLTAREAECLLLVLEVQTNDAIARELGLSTNTVRNHVKAARDKLGGSGRYDAARRYAALLAASDPSRTSPKRTIAADGEMESTDIADRSSDGAEEVSYRQAHATFAYDPSAYPPPRPDPAAAGQGPSTLYRLLAVPAGAALMAVLIVATPPMANSFKHLARLVVPLFR